MGQDDFFNPNKNAQDQRTFLHDLSNPLSIALGMLEIALEDIKKIEGIDSKTMSCLEKSLKGIFRMRDQIQKRREILIENTPKSEDKVA